MLQWTFRLCQNVTVDIVNLDVTSRQRWFSGQANTPPPSRAFFTALAANGLAINLEKCVFATPSLEILGHTISATGAAPMADHAAKIKNCPPTQVIKQLQRFLGMVNFYHHFLPKCAQILKPLQCPPNVLAGIKS